MCSPRASGTLEAMYHTIFASVNIIIVQDGKVLLGRRHNKSWGNGLLALFGGHMHTFETPTQAIMRETKEELGLTMEKGKVQFCCVAHRHGDAREYVAYVFSYQLDPRERAINNEPDQCSELVWASPAALPDDVIEDFRTILERGYVTKNPFLEVGF